MTSTRKDHWENVYQSKKPDQVSWYQLNPTLSLDIILTTSIKFDQRIIDVGGEASVLVDKLLKEGYQDISVLDISSKAIQYAKERLADQASKVTWIEADVTKFIPPRQYDIWHDRAVFHFLTESDDRKEYTEVLKKSLRPGGHAVIATFSLDGPPKCSGLNVERYDVDKLSKELGSSFRFIRSIQETHTTPWQAQQKFIYCCFRRE